jgi:hypothetical protein
MQILFRNPNTFVLIFVIMLWSPEIHQTLKETLSALETEGKKMGLRINEEKTKYMGMSPTQVKNDLSGTL